MTRSQDRASRASFREIAFLAEKSRREYAAFASSRLLPIDVAAAANCQAI
jgi:hypothetical protein